jgi:hypothetical protein
LPLRLSLEVGFAVIGNRAIFHLTRRRSSLQLYLC